MDCLFCKIVNKEIPCFKVWENEEFLAFLDIMPINKGHVLLIPKSHQEEVFDLKDDLYNKIFQIAKKLTKQLKETTKAKRIGLVIEGLGVPHAHIHLVPINKEHELNPERAKKASEDELKQMQTLIAKSFNL